MKIVHYQNLYIGTAAERATLTPGALRDGWAFYETDTGLTYQVIYYAWQEVAGGAGVTDHGALAGLGDDDHTQYHNDARGDARYYQKTEHISTSTGAPDASKPILTNGSGKVDDTFLPATAANTQGVLSAFLMIPGLYGLWPISSYDSNKDVFDLSGQGRTLSSTFTSGGVSFLVDGIIPYVQRNVSTLVDRLFRATETEMDGLRTWGGWFDASGQAQGMIGRWDSGQQMMRLDRSISTTLRLQVSTDGSSEAANVTATHTDTGWQFIVGRYNPSTELALFYDGAWATNTSGIPASLFVSTSELAFGLTGGSMNGHHAIQFASKVAVPDVIIESIYANSRGFFGV